MSEEKDNYNNRNGVLSPFKAITEGSAIKPIRFLENAEAISPLSWIATQEQLDGKVRGFKTNDSKLAGHIIPTSVDNPAEYLQMISTYLSKETTVIVPKESAQSMPRAKVTAKCVQTIDENVTSNCLIVPKIHVIYLDASGRQLHSKEKIVCQIIFDDGERQMLDVLVQDISKVYKKVKSRFAKAIFDYSEKHIEKRIENQLRKDLKNCCQIICYVDAGWNKIGHEWMYLYDGISLGRNKKVETGLNLPEYHYPPVDVGRVVLKALNLYKEKSCMSVMLTYAFMGVLYKVFAEAGFPPHFLLFLNGKTGSMKTTIGKILYTQLCEPHYRDVPRRIDADTAVSLERAVVLKGRDTVTLIDDFSPAKTENKKNEMSDKVEMLIRMVGDGSSKSRSNTNLQDCRGEGVHGMVVLTGELVGKGVSSNLRCLYCSMVRDKADLEVVSWFQQNANAFTTVIAWFARYIGVQWKEYVELIKDDFIKERFEMSQILNEKRLIDSAVTLLIASKIVVKFLEAKCQMNRIYLDEVLQTMREGIVWCTLQSQSMSVEEAPSIIFVKTVDALMRSGQIHLKKSRVVEVDVGNYDGFEEGDYYFLNPELVLKKVISFLKQTNCYFPYDTKEVTILLADDGIIKTAPNGRGKRTYYTRVKIGQNKKFNFYRIGKNVFEEIVYGREGDVK